VKTLKKPLVTAHTGCLNTLPNSIQSVIEGLNAKADIIEVDVRTTKDGVAVLLHDEEIKTPRGMRKVQDLSYEELDHLNKNEVVIRLEGVLPIVKEYKRVINIDVKVDEAIDPMITTIEKHQMRDYTIITGCEKDRALRMKNQYRPYQVFLNVSMRRDETNKENDETFIQTTYQDAIDTSCSGININYQICREEFIDYANSRYMPVSVWTIDDSNEMKKFLHMGVYSITSNEVKTLVELRDQQKGKSEREPHAIK
jgi:glycerophosphoryl diester phosphodiesterase